MVQDPYLDQILKYRLEVLQLAVVEGVDTDGALIC